MWHGACGFLEAPVCAEVSATGIGDSCIGSRPSTSSGVAEGAGWHDERAIDVVYRRAATQPKAQFQFCSNEMQHALDT